MNIAWFSGGITSAVATKIALQSSTEVLPVFIETGGHHADMPRFIKDCEKWFGVDIKIIRDDRFEDHIDLALKLKFLNSPYGAECSRTLKKKVRQKFEKEYEIDSQIFGFEFEKKEINRALRFQEQNPKINATFPLIEKKLTKPNCFAIIERAGIKVPEMYRLGYSNNNCVGCIKGGKGYWNKIRNDFPDVFNRMAEVERQIGASCINGVYLDELNPASGRQEKQILPECDLFCEIEAADIEHPRLKEFVK